MSFAVGDRVTTKIGQTSHLIRHLPGEGDVDPRITFWCDRASRVAAVIADDSQRACKDCDKKVLWSANRWSDHVRELASAPPPPPPKPKANPNPDPDLFVTTEGLTYRWAGKGRLRVGDEVLLPGTIVTNGQPYYSHVEKLGSTYQGRVVTAIGRV